MTRTIDAPSQPRTSRRKRVPDVGEAPIPLRLYGLSRATSVVATGLSILFGVFTIAPIVWIIINSTKNQAGIYGSFGFWFATPFAFFDNFARLFQNVDGDGVFVQWFGNTVLYAVVGGVGATILCMLAGYGFARYRFRGSNASFYLVLASLLIPITAISLPLYLVYSRVHLINSIWGIILPGAVSPVGVYLMRTFIEASVPQEILDSAHLDGAGELRIFVRIAVPLMVPGAVTVLLLSVVAVWNNYFLPLLIFSNQARYPLTVGIGNWAGRAGGSGDSLILPLVVIGGFVTIVPLVLLFIMLQRYWRGGLLLGSVTG
jgi:multiple sugar transport system permease protein